MKPCPNCPMKNQHTSTCREEREKLFIEEYLTTKIPVNTLAVKYGIYNYGDVLRSKGIKMRLHEYKPRPIYEKRRLEYERIKFKLIRPVGEPIPLKSKTKLVKQIMVLLTEELSYD